MANRLSRKITFIYHSEKMVDEDVISMFSSLQSNEIKFVNLANSEISVELLKKVTTKLSNWQRVLLDTRYLDRSIRNPEHEFLLMEDSLKILFLQKNSWLIATPLVIDNNKAFRFKQATDAIEWLNAKNIRRLKDLTDHLIEVPSAL